MKFQLLFIFFLLFPGYVLCCDCTFWSFCDHLEENIEYAVFMVETPNENDFYTSDIHDKYFDVKVIDQIFGFPTGLDSLTLVEYGTSCDIPIQYFSDTIIIKLVQVEKDSSSNYPIFSIFTCLHNTLQVENDTVRGNISEVDSKTPWDSNERMSYPEFLHFYEQNCSIAARFPDLDELKGVELLGNPIYTTLALKNNLDKEISFSIYSINGSYLREGRVSANSTLEENVQDLYTGVYFVRVDDGIGKKFHKLLKL